MMNFKNCLMGIEIDERCFNFLKDELSKKYDFALFNDMLTLPCMQFESRNKLLLLFALLEDGEINDGIIDMLCSLLANISEKLWHDFSERLKMLIESKYLMLSRSQKLRLAHTVEVMSAKGYKNGFELSNLIYQRIPLSDGEFNPDSDDNVRIKLAKIAYSTCNYNFNEKLKEIDYIKHHLKNSGRKYLMGVVNYYKGLCLKATAVKVDYKDNVYYIMKSKTKGFALADIYLDYRTNNFETSSEV